MTLLETNSKSTWKLLLGIISFFGVFRPFQGRTVSFREGYLSRTPSSRAGTPHHVSGGKKFGDMSPLKSLKMRDFFSHHPVQKSNSQEKDLESYYLKQKKQERHHISDSLSTRSSSIPCGSIVPRFTPLMAPAIPELWCFLSGGLFGKCPKHVNQGHIFPTELQPGNMLRLVARSG